MRSCLQVFLSRSVEPSDGLSGLLLGLVENLSMVACQTQFKCFINFVKGQLKDAIKLYLQNHNIIINEISKI